MLPHHLRSRYKARSYKKLATRVARVLSRGNSKNKSRYQKQILAKKFIPAGNTLLAGIDPVMPNCSILPSINEKNLGPLLSKAKNLWKKRIGIGFDLSTAEDPIRILDILSQANHNIVLSHRPNRGNMAVLRYNHPRILEFVYLKNMWSINRDFSNFNLSVAFEGDPEGLDILDDISAASWSSGDPGIIFLDHIRDQVPYNLNTKILDPIETVVPCGEQGMHPHEVCTLGSINIAHTDFWLKSPGRYDREAPEFNIGAFIETVALAVEMLDSAFELIDFDHLGDQDITRVSEYTKRLGLGIMGWADALKNLNIPYDNDMVKPYIDIIGTTLRETAHQKSRELHVGLEDSSDRNGRKHLTVTCVAPTGGITLLTDNSGYAIEPRFDEANDIHWRDHLKHVVWWQKYIDNSISKTINLPSDISVDEIKNVYNTAYGLGLKAVTVYRNTSSNRQPISCEMCV